MRKKFVVLLFIFACVNNLPSTTVEDPPRVPSEEEASITTDVEISIPEATLEPDTVIQIIFDQYVNLSLIHI